MSDTPQTEPAAFKVRNLAVLAYAQGFTLWHYKAPHALAPTMVPGYFTPFADNIGTGDMIMISATDGGKIVIVEIVDKSARVVRLT
jgi:hypothetical protein